MKQYHSILQRLDGTARQRRRAFGAAVRARRKTLGLSQEALAGLAGCDRQSINRVENAAYSPSLDRVFPLADALGCTVGDLFADVDVILAEQKAGAA